MWPLLKPNSNNWPNNSQWLLRKNPNAFAQAASHYRRICRASTSDMNLTLCQCGQCGHELIKIREDVTEQLDVVPAVFTVHRHIRPQYACKNCETITAAPIPAAVINGGMAAVGLLVWVLISKYVDHLPLYRLEQIAARQQVVLSRSTLADWVGRLGVALQPLVDRLTWHLLQGNTLHADESVPRRRAQKVKVLQCSHAAQEMRVGPSESPYRRRLQTTYCCYV